MKTFSRSSDRFSLPLGCRLCPLNYRELNFAFRTLRSPPKLNGPGKIVNKGYDLLRGQPGAYVNIVRLMSMQSRMEDFYSSGNPVTQIRLDSHKDLDRVFQVAINKSQSEGLQHVYSTFFYNCTTMAFDIVEAGQRQF